MVRFDAICLCSFLVAEHACCNNNHEGNSDTADKRRPRRTGEAGKQIPKQADDGNQGSVGKLDCPRGAGGYIPHQQKKGWWCRK